MGAQCSPVVGAALLTATQTFSGANTFAGTAFFTSSVTVGNYSFTSTASYQAALLGGWTVVAVASSTSFSSIQFSNLSSSYTYRVHYALRWVTTGGNATVRINNDSGTNYYETAFGLFTNGSSDNVATPASTSMRIQNTGGGASTPLTGYFELNCIDFVCDIHGQSNYDNSATRAGLVYFHRYNGTTNLSSLTISPSAGTWRGHVWLEALLAPY